MYPTCNGTFVVFQTDISAELLDRGHDNDRSVKGPEYMSAAHSNGFMSSCLSALNIRPDNTPFNNIQKLDNTHSFLFMYY